MSRQENFSQHTEGLTLSPTPQGSMSNAMKQNKEC